MRGNEISAKRTGKALFIGLGSVGQRHLQNFKALVSAETRVMAYRTSASNQVIQEGRVVPGMRLADQYRITEYHDLKQALRQKPDVGFVCNPSNQHLKTAIQLATNGCHVFIEKPLATSTEGLRTLENLIKKNKLITMVGYQTRFHPAVQEVKVILDEQRYGHVMSADFLWHTYLPDFHPYEDYRQGYAARSDLGGGVIFGLSHELDLLQWLLGVPRKVFAVEGAPSKLEGNTEDTVAALFQCTGSHGTFPVTVSISYAQGLEQRKFCILMQDAVLECDLRQGKLNVVPHHKKAKIIKEYTSVQRNDLFKSEMKNFLTSVTKRSETAIPLSEGRRSLMMSLSMHRSLNTGTAVNIPL